VWGVCLGRERERGESVCRARPRGAAFRPAPFFLYSVWLCVGGRVCQWRWCVCVCASGGGVCVIKGRTPHHPQGKGREQQQVAGRAAASSTRCFSLSFFSPIKKMPPRQGYAPLPDGAAAPTNGGAGPGPGSDLSASFPPPSSRLLDASIPISHAGTHRVSGAIPIFARPPGGRRPPVAAGARPITRTLAPGQVRVWARRRSRGRDGEQRIGPPLPPPPAPSQPPQTPHHLSPSTLLTHHSPASCNARRAASSPCRKT